MESTNKDYGNVYQDTVADFISKTCDIPREEIKVKAHCGYDIVVNDWKMEVKAISTLTTINSYSDNGTKNPCYNRFTIDYDLFPKDIDVVAFVYADQALLDEPIVRFVYPEPVLLYINRTNAKKMNISLLKLKEWLESGGEFPIRVLKTKNPNE